MSIASIQIDFAEAKAQAQKLEDIADEMKSLANRSMANTIQEISSGWSGEAASAYFAKAEKVRRDISNTADSLYSTARSIRAQAKRIYDAEMRAIELATTKTNT